MKAELNPYEPPVGDFDPLTEPRGTGKDWQIEGDFLLVRDGAILPEVCILSGEHGSPGSWTRLPLHELPGSLRLSPAIHVTAYRSRRAAWKRFIRLFGGILLGFSSGIGSSIFMVGDGSATPLSIGVSCLLIGLGCLVALWERQISVRQMSNGWFQVYGLAPGAISGFKAQYQFLRRLHVVIPAFEWKPSDVSHFRSRSSADQ